MIAAAAWPGKPGPRPVAGQPPRPPPLAAALPAWPLVRPARLPAPRPIHALLLAFALLAATYSLVTPLLEAPDEAAHLQYVLHLARGRGLPVQPFRHDQVQVVQGHHPPLYYALGALATAWIDTRDEFEVLRENPRGRMTVGSTGDEPNYVLHTAAEMFPWRGYALAARLVRLLSILFGLVTVWATYRLGRLLTGREAVALGAAGLVAFNPQFLFISGVANNDSAVTAFLTLALLWMAALLVEGPSPRRAGWLGIWLGLAMLSKATALAWCLPLAYTLGLLWWRDRDGWRLARLAAALALPFLALSGWWFARNQALYGDPLGYRMFLATASVIFEPSDLADPATWRWFAVLTHQTFWGHFGWLASPLAPRWVLALAALYPLAPLGAALGWLWRREAGTWAGLRQPAAWGLMALTLLVTLAWTLNFARTNGSSAFQGRYLFPAIAAIALLITGGISLAVPDRWRGAALALLLAPLAALALVVPRAYIAPVYRFVTVPESTLATLPHRLTGQFGPAIALAGYRREDAAGAIALQLYWRALGPPGRDYRVRVRALGEAGRRCGEQAGPVQDGGFPTSWWRSGDLVEDRRLVGAEAACCGPAGCRLLVELRPEGGGPALPFRAPGGPPAAAALLAP